MRVQAQGLFGMVLPVLFGLLGCTPPATGSASNSSTVNNAKADPVFQAPSNGAAVLELWSQSCALCHVDGNAGAPRIGNVDEWAPRLAKGQAVLIQHTLDGFNQMPPLGYCMACDRSDFVAMIEFMTRDIEPSQVGDTQ